MVSVLSERDDGAAFIFGELDKNPLIRLQSRCLYGEVFGSTECDCRDQLDLAWSLISGEGSGAVVYLEQEGRGAGLAMKAKAYRQYHDYGADTFTSYLDMTGGEVDFRSYELAVQLLMAEDVNELRLLTNNPAKISALQHLGLAVQRVPLVVEPRSHAAAEYLHAKRNQGHLL